MNPRRNFLRRSLALGIGAAGISHGAFAIEGAPSLQIQRLAWAGVRLRLGTANLYLDPLLNPDVWGAALPDKLVPVGSPDGDRFVLVTHRHPDHFDPVAVKAALAGGGTLVSAASGGPLPLPEGARARLAPLYEPQILGDFTAAAVPASDGYGDPQVSWVVSAAGKRVIHCGDTLWHGSWWHIARLFGPFDVAFLPINGARFKWRKPASEVPGVMAPEEAVEAAVVLGARTLVPIHYGVTGADGYEEQADLVRRLSTAAARRGVRTAVLQPGAWMNLE